MSQSVSHAGLAPELAHALAQLPRVGDPASSPAHRMRVLAAVAQHATRARSTAELQAVIQSALPAAIRADGVLLRLDGDAESATDESALVRPVGGGDEVFGTLCIQGGPFTDEDEAAADAFAAIAAEALARIRLVEQAEERLAAAEDSYRTLFDLTGDAISVMDARTGEVLDINRAALELHGHGLDEFRDRTAPRMPPSRPEFSAERGAELLERAAAGEPQRYAWTTLTRDGDEIFWEARLMRIRLGGRDVLVNVARDVRERNAAEDALRRANEQLEARVAERTSELGSVNEALEEEVAEHEAAKEALLERTTEMEAIFRALPDLFFRLTGDCTVLDYRAGDSAVLAAPPELFLWRRLHDVMPPEVMAIVDQAMERARETRAPAVAEYAMELPHGRRDFEARIVALPDGTFVTVVRDVTERAEAERALREREAHFRRMIENASDMVQIVGPDTLIAYTGPSMERLLGWTPEEIEGTSAMDYLHPDDVEPTLVQFGLMLQQPGVPVPASYRVRHKHGGYRWMEANAMTLAEDSGTQGVIVNARDVTERRVFEEALRLSEEQFRTLTEHSSDIPTIVSPTKGVLYVSPSVSRVLGWPQAEMMGPEARDLTHPDDLPLILDALRAADAEPGATRSARYRVRHADGSWRVVESIIRKTSAEAEAPLVLNTRDITEQTHAEEALRRSEEQFRLLSEHSSDVPSILSPTGESLYISPAVTRVLGYTPDEVAGHRGQASRIHPDDVASLAELMRATAADPAQPHGVHYRVRHKDGSWRVMETVARRTAPHAEAPLVANTRDITALRQAEEALRQREEQFRMLIEHSSDIPTIVSASGEVVYVSPSITRMLGYLPEEMTGPEGVNGTHPDDLPIVARALAAAAAEPGRTFIGQYRARAKDGSWRVLNTVIRKTGPQPDAPMVANTRDITEQTRAEEALRRSEEYFRKLIENAQDLITVIAPDGTRRFESAAIRNLYGYAEEEGAGGSAWERLHPGDVAPARAALGSVMRSPGSTVTVELRFRAANGGWRNLECKARMLGTDPEEGIVVNSRDITERVEAQRRLSEREEFFRQLTENTNDLMQVCDAEGFITYSASSSPAILGYTPEELLGRQVMDLLHPDDLEPAHAATALVLGQPGRVDITEARFLHASGEYRWMESTARTLDPASAASGIAFSLRDVSQRRAAQEAIRRSEEHFRRLTENASDMIVVVDEESFFLYHSPSVQRVLGYTPDELDALRSLDVIHPDDVAGVTQALERMCAEPGSTHTVEYRFPHADGGWRTLESTGRTLLPDSAAEGIVINSRDVTDRRAAERALRRATDEAERANRAKSEFLSRMSHELRTPMNSILGFAQILAELDLAPEDLKAVQHILSAGEHLLNLINEVLDIARIESGRQPLSLEPVQVGAVMREALDLVRPLAAARGISVAETAGPLGRYVRADRQRLAQVLLNLLSNAVKYNRPGGAVRLSCRVVDGAGAPRLAVRVEDDGYGIAPEKQALLFTPFARLGAEQSGIEGTGLGLTLSERLVGAMGGTLRLEESGERGSVFRLELDAAENPLDRADAPAEPADAGLPPEGTAATLLYVEDNLANLSLIERVLMGRPEWRLLPALQGQMGVEMAREHRPDVVLLDLHLPDLSGEEVLRQLRADPRTAHIPVVIISADATPRTLDRLRADGAAAYLTKPLNVRLFLRTVDEALAGREGRG